MKQHKYLIVGGGMTADAAVKGIRELDDSGPITIITSEPDPPYARPPLSKDLWTEDTDLDDIDCKTEQKGADVCCDTRVVTVDSTRKVVTDEKGEEHRYERLLLATGGRPRELPIGNGHVHYFRTRQDYRLLRDLADRANHIAVLGGGFIGAELTAALTKNEKKVTMVFPEAAVCGRMLPTDLATSLNQYYQEHGVTVVAGRKPSKIEEDQGVLGIHLENGHTFSVDGIVAGIGIEPNTQLADGLGIAVDDGIMVDEQLRTKHPHVYAAGDVARFYQPVLDTWMRVEHEDNALTMGKMAGRNMAGEQQPYQHMPYFYSDLFDLGYEAVGETTPSLEVITDIKAPDEKGCITYMQDGQVRGIVFWNLFGHVDAGRELIAAPGPHDADSLRAWQKERLKT